MPEIDWDSLPDAPKSESTIDWDALPDADPVPERKPRFDWQSANPLSGGDPIAGGAKLALQGLGSGADLVKAGADKIVAGVPLSESLDRYYKNDPSYIPGDAAVEKIIPEENWATRGAAKTALDIGSDPTTWVAAMAKGAPLLAKLAEQAEQKSPGLALKTLGKVGEFFTGGRMSPRWASSVSKFSPKERIFSGSTLDKAADAYHPLKEAADDVMSGRANKLASEIFNDVTRAGDDSLGRAFDAVPDNPKFKTLDEAASYFDDAVNKMRRMNNGGEPPAQILAIQERLNQIRSSGKTSAPDTAEIMDFLNNIEYTGMGNPRLVKDIFKGPQSDARAALKGLTEESSPVYAAARQKFSDAKTMVAPPSGGKMGKYMIQNAPTMAATAGAAGEISGGKWGDAAKVAGTILGLRNPKAYNVAAGVGAGLSDSARALAGVASEAVGSQLGKQAIVQSTKVDLGSLLQEDPGAFGEFAPMLQSAKERGPAALSSTNHILMTGSGKSSEAYRAMMRKINGQEDPNQ